MNKNIKRIIALTISIMTCMGIQSTNLDFMTTAYATGNVYLKSISLSKGDIKFDIAKSAYELQVDETVKELEITAKPDCSTTQYDKYTVDINGTVTNKNDNYRSTVKLEEGQNIIRLRVEYDEYDEEDEDKGDNVRTYTLYVNRGSNNSKVTGQDELYLSSLTLSDGDLDFSKKTSFYNVNVAENVDSMIVKGKSDDENYDIEIDGVLVNENDEYKRKVYLNKGKNIITVAVKNHYSDARTYTIYVNRGTEGVTNYNQNQDLVYLDYIDLSDASIDFDKDKTSYDISVKDSLEKITIQSEAADYDNTVKIAGSVVDEDTDYKKTVYLNKGKNSVEVKVVSDDKQRSYIINITRGTATTTNEVTTNNSATTTVTNEIQQTNNINKWIQTNGKWQYYDIKGNLVKNTWFFDKNHGESYYLTADGYMATGWLLNNGQWYYLDGNGAKQTGWKCINETWYNLDGAGIMKIGWLSDNGKWYYLYESGAMASNTNISGYKIGSNGYWIK